MGVGTLLSGRRAHPPPRSQAAALSRVKRSAGRPFTHCLYQTQDVPCTRKGWKSLKITVFLIWAHCNILGGILRNKSLCCVAGRSWRSAPVANWSDKMFADWARLLEILQTLLLPKQKTDLNFPLSFPLPHWISILPASPLPPPLQVLRSHLIWSLDNLVNDTTLPEDRVQGPHPFKSCIHFSESAC